MNKSDLLILILFIAVTLSSSENADSVYSGPPKVVAELGLAHIPDTMSFARSDSGILQYNWSVRLRIFADSSNVPDVFGLSIKYTEGPGKGDFTASILQTCEQVLERVSKERVFYRVGNLKITPTDSSYLLSAQLNPSFVEGMDSAQVYAVTDKLSPYGYVLRDMTENYGQLGEIIYDPPNDMNDKRFDIRFARAEILGLLLKK